MNDMSEIPTHDHVHFGNRSSGNVCSIIDAVWCENSLIQIGISKGNNLLGDGENFHKGKPVVKKIHYMRWRQIDFFCCDTGYFELIFSEADQVKKHTGWFLEFRIEHTAKYGGVGIDL